jgi:serine/threonine protein kinase
MDSELRQRIEEAVTIALGLPPEQRAEWLSITLPADPFLASEVRRLLAELPEAQEQLEGTAARVAAGMRVGPYRVLSELGHGGMGAVYLAVRDDPSFTQKVALKLVKRGMDTDEIVRRFVAERQILASLAHPNIARLLDGGSTAEGRPYFVMEYV